MKALRTREGDGKRTRVAHALWLLGVLVSMTVSAGAARAQAYRFTRVADSAQNGFSPFSFECSAINNRGDVVFRTARVPKRPGPLIQGIYRAEGGEHDVSDVELTTIAEFDGGFDFLGRIPSINDRGDVSFAVAQILEPEIVERQRVMRGNGETPTTTVASTEDEFARFGFEPTVNDSGIVAFKADLDDFDTFDNENGLFSGPKNAQITVHYLSATSKFSEFSTLSRPAINDLGDIAFEESVDGQSMTGIFVTRGTDIAKRCLVGRRERPCSLRSTAVKTIAAPDPDVFVDRPNLNDAGTVVFHRFFNTEPGEELVRGEGGPLTTIADTKGPFQSFNHFFGFVPPALNDEGDVAFLADLDAGPRGIYVGPDPVRDRVIETGDLLDGFPVTDLRFCDQGLNDAGQLVFQATFADPRVPEGLRVAVYRATPRRAAGGARP